MGSIQQQVPQQYLQLGTFLLNSYQNWGEVQLIYLQIHCRFVVIGNYAKGTGTIQVLELTKGTIKSVSEVCPSHKSLYPYETVPLSGRKTFSIQVLHICRISS